MRSPVALIFTGISTEVVHGALGHTPAGVWYVVPFVQPDQLERCALAKLEHRFQERNATALQWFGRTFRRCQIGGEGGVTFGSKRCDARSMDNLVGFGIAQSSKKVPDSGLL